MEKEEKSHQWSLAYFGLVAVVIGGIIADGGSWYIWHLQQEALDAQNLEEQQNIAHAIYIDILNIEVYLNDSILNIDYDKLEKDPSYVATYTHRYNNNWLFPVFSLDIAKLDKTTSEDLYDFYRYVADIEDQREFVYSIMDKQLHGEKVELADAITAHKYTRNQYKILIPECISLAEKAKNELRLKYHVKATLNPEVVHDPRAQPINVQGIDISTY